MEHVAIGGDLVYRRVGIHIPIDVTIRLRLRGHDAEDDRGGDREGGRGGAGASDIVSHTGKNQPLLVAIHTALGGVTYVDDRAAQMTLV